MTWKESGVPFTSDGWDLEHSGHGAVSAYLQRMIDEIGPRRGLTLGYQINQAFDFTALSPFLNMHLNNVGDPYTGASHLLNTRDLERSILAFFAGLWRAEPFSRSLESPWGFVLSMGATEGNMYALWNARDYVAGSPLLHMQPGTEPMREPVVFYSDQAHYSIVKCAAALAIKTFHQAGSQRYPGRCPITDDGSWPLGVPSEDGVIDPQKLAILVDFFAQHGHPPIVVLNLGTTFHGAYDDPPAVWSTISPVLEHHGLYSPGGSRQRFWIHIDGALGAGYLPYLEMAHIQQSGRWDGPLFDFRLPFINSLVVSSHKWFGSPVPGGIYMTKEKYRLEPPSQPEYVATPDTTLAGSRNGLSALMLWHRLATTSKQQQADEALRCSQLADDAHAEFQQLQEKIPDFWSARSKMSLAIRFKRPGPETFQNFGLSGQDDAAHIFVMPHVTRQAVSKLIESIRDEYRAPLGRNRKARPLPLTCPRTSGAPAFTAAKVPYT
ncbi:pyridoxal-dependent decarboxylase [Streptomyces sp. NPDC004787]|uniref:pyridoxal-dependent decarboxylase n=1 Tax=Streptomyces sp. NPDC004787 TaxID=3154291 RepID=UPI0033BA3BA9